MHSSACGKDLILFCYYIQSNLKTFIQLPQFMVVVEILQINAVLLKSHRTANKILIFFLMLFVLQFILVHRPPPHMNMITLLVKQKKK